MHALADRLTREANDYERYCTSLASRFSDDLKNLKQSVAKQEEQNRDLRTALGSVIDHASEIFEDEDDDDVNDFFQKIPEILKVLPFAAESSDARTRVERLQGAYAETLAVFRDAQKDLKRWKFDKRMLMQLHADRLVNNDEELRLAQENEMLDAYEARIKEYNENGRMAEMQAIVKSVKDLTLAMCTCEEKRESFLKNFEEKDLLTDCFEIENLRVKIEKIREEIRSCDERLGTLETEYALLSESHIAKRGIEEEAQQTCEVMNACFNGNLEALMKKVTCPICGVKKRDTILIGCGHVLCRGCIDACEVPESCPYCLKSYRNTDLRPFLRGLK
jgi:hypothetical protein